MTKLYLLPFLFFILSKCTTPLPPEEPIFQNEITEGATPWIHTDFDNDSDKFSFAIISDLTGGEREGIFSTAVAQINLLRPELVISVGDLIEGGTEDQDHLIKEWESFDSRASQLTAPLFHVGGNHDLTNAIQKEVWNERYGSTYYHFLYKNVLFLVLDTEDYPAERLQEIYLARAKAIDILDGKKEGVWEETEYYSMPERSTGEISQKQSAYFEDILAKYVDVRWTMIFVHKSVWQREGDGGLTSIESAMGERSYSLFNGHFHSFSHTEKNGRDYTMLGTTGGAQKPGNENAFDHISLVTMAENGPSIAHIKMEGILDKTGAIPTSD